MAAKVTLDACPHANPTFHPMKSSFSRLSDVVPTRWFMRRDAVGYRLHYGPRWRIYSFSKELESLDDVIKDTRSARRTGCDFCQHPCHGIAQTASPCEVSLYLETWQKDIGKPENFDAFHFESHGSGIEAAVVSLGGRHGNGWKKENQDDFFVLPIATEGDAPHYAVGVFDGHGEFGHVASSLAKMAFMEKFELFARSGGGKLLNHHSLGENLVRQLFEHTSRVIDSYACDLSKSGSTAVVCLVSQEKVIGGWIGDSRAIVGITEPLILDDEVATQSEETLLMINRVMVPLTRDHKPDPLRCPSEANRVTRAGGRIDRLATDARGRPTGPFRLFLKDRWTPGLAVSRSFGDHIAQEAGLVSLPEIQTLPLMSRNSLRIRSTDMNQIIIMGTDGLWEWVSSQEAMDIAWGANSAKEAAEALAELAQKNWALNLHGRACDDITVAVVFLPLN